MFGEEVKKNVDRVNNWKKYENRFNFNGLNFPIINEDIEKFEEIIEIPTMMKILEIAGGLKLNDPNLLGAALVGTN